MIPKTNTANFPPFIKLPNQLENKPGEIEIGDKVQIENEFAPPENPKLKSPFIGNVSLTNTDLRTLGLNWTSYYSISKVYGMDTVDWVGKHIIYTGMKKTGKGAIGHLWTAEL